MNKLLMESPPDAGRPLQGSLPRWQGTGKPGVLLSDKLYCLDDEIIILKILTNLRASQHLLTEETPQKTIIHLKKRKGH